MTVTSVKITTTYPFNTNSSVVLFVFIVISFVTSTSTTYNFLKKFATLTAYSMTFQTFRQLFPTSSVKTLLFVVRHFSLYIICLLEDWGFSLLLFNHRTHMLNKNKKNVTTNNNIFNDEVRNNTRNIWKITEK